MSLLTSSQPSIVEAPRSLRDMCELHRMNGDAVPARGAVTFVPPTRAAALSFLAPGTLAVLIAEQDEPLLSRFADAVRADDMDLMTDVAQRLGAQIDAARAAEIGASVSRSFCDIEYAGRCIARTVVVDSALAFNFVAFEYHGGDLNPDGFGITSFSVAPDAAPLRAVIVAKPAALTEIEAEALRQVPPGERFARVYLASKKAPLVDDIGARVRNVPNRRSRLEQDLNIDRLNRLVDVLADRVADRLVDRLADRIAGRRVAVLGPVRKRRSIEAPAASLSDVDSQPTVNELLALRASIFHERA